MLSLKEISDFLLRSLFLCVGFCTVYTVLLARHNALIIESFKKHDLCSHLGKTIDTLIIDDNF